MQDGLETNYHRHTLGVSEFSTTFQSLLAVLGLTGGRGRDWPSNS
jgi:hypothetical protein